RSVRKPPDQRRHRRDVANTKPATAEDTIAKIDEPQVVNVDAERGDDETTGPAECRSEHRPARSALLDPTPKHRRGNAKKENRNRENPTEFGQSPVAFSGLRNTKELRHRQIENTERIGLADAQVHAQCGRWDHPAAEARVGNSVIAIEKTHCALPS